jgi:molybdopterin synthase sulfur carrier subunit
MQLSILYFAQFRESIGASSEVVDLPPDMITVADLVRWLSNRSHRHQAAFMDLGRVRVAVDQAMADFDQDISGASEIAFFPPVTGG